MSLGKIYTDRTKYRRMDRTRTDRRTNNRTDCPLKPGPTVQSFLGPRVRFMYHVLSLQNLSTKSYRTDGESKNGLLFDLFTLKLIDTFLEPRCSKCQFSKKFLSQI
ncbi:hypothetical protein J6590_085551 [Homalodisca vitripennis]|nr:hypothetical protein J6590_085551 [Homalodisca vitripennis]